MSNPQPPEPPSTVTPGEHLPPDNQPGHHPAKEQDKPDAQAFAEKFGIVEAAEPGSDATPDSERDRGRAPRASVDLGPVAGRGKAYAGVLISAVLLLFGFLLTKRRRSRGRKR